MGQPRAAVSGIVDEAMEITEDTFAAVKPEERRKFARRNARWLCVITTRDKMVIQCRTLDLSERGASIICPFDFEINSLFVLELHVRYKGLQKKMRILSEVKRTSIAKDGFTLGLYFKDATDTVFDFLQKYSNEKI